MYSDDHTTSLLSFYITRFIGRTDIHAVRQSHQLPPVCTSLQDVVEQIPPSHTHWALATWCWYGPFLLSPCFRVNNAHGGSLPLEAILTFSALKGPKTVGPWRTLGSLLRLKFLLVVPKWPLSSENCWHSSSPRRRRQRRHFLASGNTQTKGGYWTEGRNQSEVFLLSILQINFHVNFLLSTRLREGVSRLSGWLSSRLR